MAVKTYRGQLPFDPGDFYSDPCPHCGKVHIMTEVMARHGYKAYCIGGEGPGVETEFVEGPMPDEVKRKLEAGEWHR